MKYQEKQFNIKRLEGISESQIEEHLKLYSGYVKHVNLISEKVNLLSEDKENNSYIISEIRRRFGFEFNGMRLHEYYFEQFEAGVEAINENDSLVKFLIEKYRSFELGIDYIKEVALARGVGWVILCYDRVEKTTHVVWVSDHEIGQLGGLDIIMVLDMWEHAFMVDYTPSEKKKYIEAFFENLNWGVAQKRFNDIIKR